LKRGGERGGGGNIALLSLQEVGGLGFFAKKKKLKTSQTMPQKENKVLMKKKSLTGKTGNN